ncbi:MAG: hypothetical protein Q8M58_14870 [Anaerolineales bacterium]|nr:hypothetical protein [Anaerolineales bacterium]
MNVEVVGEITEIKVIASGNSIRDHKRLRKQYGASRWRKLKGIALVCFPDGSLLMSEVHWYEAQGIGRKELKVKRILRL